MVSLLSGVHRVLVTQDDNNDVSKPGISICTMAQKQNARSVPVGCLLEQPIFEYGQWGNENSTEAFHTMPSANSQIIMQMLQANFCMVICDYCNTVRHYCVSN